MKSTGIKVVQLTSEEMLNHEAKEYNPKVWEKRINSLLKLEALFYIEQADRGRFKRFYVSYKIHEGLHFLSDFTPYINTLTSNGFVKAFIVNNFLENFYKKLGKSYLQPHQEGLVSLFSKLRSSDFNENLSKGVKAEEAIKEIIKNI